MKGPAVYIERDPSGQRLLGLRLIGEHEAEHYKVPEEAAPTDAVRFAAEWLRSKLDAKNGSGISLLCLDPRGAVCSWLDVPGSDDSVLKAAVRQSSAGAWGEWASQPALAAAGTVESLAPQSASSLEPLGVSKDQSKGSALTVRRQTQPQDQSNNRRSAVLAIGDLPVRLLIDALDEMHIEIGQVLSLWHTMTTAWDPSTETRDTSDPLVSSVPMDTAVVLVEPNGRVQWAWSDRGELIAAGSALVEQDAFESDDNARKFGSGRLAMDWLAWTAQLGRSPKRVLCLIDNDHGSQQGSGAFGQAIAGVWPSASVDLLRVDDPVLSTFLRLSERTAGGKIKRELVKTSTISMLRDRPGRTHRQMYRWIAGVVLVGAIGVGILGYKIRSTGSRAMDEAASIKAQVDALVLTELGDRADPMYPLLSLQSELDKARTSRNASSSLTAAHPVLRVIDDVSFFVNSMGDVRLTRLTINQSLQTIDLEADTTEQIEEAPEILQNAMRGLIDWQNGTIRPRGDVVTTSILGYWSENDSEPGS